jgi:hypothetical protein
MQALLPAVGRAGLMSAAGNVAGQTAQFAGRMVPYLPAIGQFFGGDPLGAGVTAGATKLAPKGTKTAVGLATSLLAPPVLGAVGSGAQQLAGAVSRGQMARGESPGPIPGVGGKGIEGMSIEDLQTLAKLQPQIAEQLMPTYNAMRNADMNRQMQMNQQLGQLTGALNQQKYMAQLAGGAQSEAGATTRSILTAANPYAASAFQYRG